MNLSLGEKQRLFASLIPRLIDHIIGQGYEVTLGDAYAKPRSPLEHSEKSAHYDRLAIDLNLFKSGVYLTSSEDHKPFGDFWKSLHPLCTWGGNFKKPDGNHYSFGEGKR
jgi:hypothetical protein